MTLKERDEKLKLLEDIIENREEDPTKLAVQLCKIWIDGLWEVSDDSFEEFLASEFEMTEADAFMAMKLAAGAGKFPEDVAAKIDKEFERIA
jgi:hypothetical protein